MWRPSNGSFKHAWKCQVGTETSLAGDFVEPIGSD